LFKNLTNLIQKPFPQHLREWAEAQKPYFLLLEKDLARLVGGGISISELRTCYKIEFINDSNILETIFEIHLGAMLSRLGSRLDIHPQKSKQSKKNYDFKVTIGSVQLNFEMKTRKDMFPFTPGKREPFACGRRETVDRRFLGGTNDGTSESTVIREIIEKALIQLPDIGPNFVVIGQIYTHTVKQALIDMNMAVFGDLAHYVERRNPDELLRRRLPNGIFNSDEKADRYKKLNGVIWQYLEKNHGELEEYSCVFFNNAVSAKTPAHAEELIKQTFIKNIDDL
jgi:hypothetical protein